MDNEKQVREELLQLIKSRAENANKTKKAQYNCQLQFLREFKTTSCINNASQNNQSAYLTKLLTAAAEEDDELKTWLIWLHQLLLINVSAFCVDNEILIDWLLHEKHTDDVHALRCLALLLKILTPAEARQYWPRLAVIRTPSCIEAAYQLVLCLDTIFPTLYADNAQLEDKDLQLSSQVVNSLLQPHYEGVWLQHVRVESEKPDSGRHIPQLLLHSLQLLQKIAIHNAAYVEAHTPQLLGFALANVQFGGGSEAQVLLQQPRRVQPSQQAACYQHEEDVNNANSVPTRSDGRQAKARKLRSIKKQRHNASANVENLEATPANHTQQLLLLGNDYGGHRTGDSEGYTPSDEPTQQPSLMQQRHSSAKVRLAALHLLGAVTKQLPRRTLYSYWHVLFPANADAARQSLLYIGKTDNSPRCRALALQIAAQLLYGSKSYLSQASSSGPSNYTPFAVSLATLVLSAYDTLSAILEREFAPPVLTQCLKCLAVLVQATPFEQLEMGFVYGFVPQVKKLIKHEEITVQVSALLVMEMLVAAPQLTQEVACAVGLPGSEQYHTKIVRTAPRMNLRQQEQDLADLCDSEYEEEPDEPDETQESTQNATNSDTTVASTHIPRYSWLLRCVCRYLESSTSLPQLRVECLQVLLAMATHFALLRDHLTRLVKILCDTLENQSLLEVRLYAARCLDTIAYQMTRHVLELSEQARQQHLVFWQQALPSIYANYNATATPSLKCALCDALSNMGTYCFERMPQPQRNGLLAFLSGCSSDDAEEPLVRAAALRALAVYLMHPTLRADLVFVENTAELALRLAKDTQLHVRIKAAWALGNISDALVGGPRLAAPLNMEVDLRAERISDSLLYRLIDASTTACTDHDKVRSNAVRALGNLLRLLSAAQLDSPDVRSLMQRAIGKLIDCVRAAGSAKVKWNACYAIGSLMRNRALFAANTSIASTLFPALCQLIVHHVNFKVRINATSVLLQIEQRSDYGSYYAALWRALLAALERSNALDSFEEYNHRDGLQHQLCLAIAHMLGQARCDDLPLCRDALEPELDVVSSIWRRVAFRIVPEQAAPLFTCGQLLEQRMLSSQEGTLTGEQRNALKAIVEALRLEA